MIQLAQCMETLVIIVHCVPGDTHTFLGTHRLLKEERREVKGAY